MTDYSCVLDDNERTRMLAEGYQPEVIEWTAKKRYEAALADFKDKNIALGRYYEPLSYFGFVDEVWPGIDRLMVVTTEREEYEKGYQELDIDELMDYQAYRADVCVVPATFINGRYSLACCKDIHALVIDLDGIEADVLRTVIENGGLGQNVPQPSYIVNSGFGVHLYYAFKNPVPFYHKNRKPLKAMYDRLCYFTKKGIAAKTDKHALTQPFRLPGSLTKIGQTATAFKSGEKWSVAMLGRRLGVEVDGMDLAVRPVMPQRDYHEAKAKWEAQQAASSDKPRKKREWQSPLEGNEGFYQSCLRRCYDETEEGSRYKSMFAMAAVGYKVRLPKEQVEADLAELLAHYNGIGKRMKQSEVKKAMGGYCAKADTFSSARLEEYFGWKFGRNSKKVNGRKQADHLRRARAVQLVDYPDGEWRNKNGAPTKEQTVKDWRAAHPDGKPRECMEATGLSKNTVYKWWNT